MISTILFLSIMFFLYLSFFNRALFFPEKVFLALFSVSTMYYGVAGLWYWFEYNDGVFLGVNWSASYQELSLAYLIVYLLAVISFLFFYRLFDRFFDVQITRVADTRHSYMEVVLWVVSLPASVYVIIQGGSAGTLNDLTSDPLLLVMLQFSTMLIPLLLVNYIRQTSRIVVLILTLAYLGYCSIVGLRSLALLLLFPLGLNLFVSAKAHSKFRVFILGFLSSCILGVFSLLTLARKKFEGIDFDVALDAGFEDILYGFFAESNISFGLASVFEMFGKEFEYSGIGPVLDVFIQFIPRAIYPEKDLYQHFQVIAYGLGNSLEAYASGTSQPFFGEYYAMAGWFGIVLGVVVYSAAAAFILNYIGIFKKNYKLYVSWIGLISVFFAYYYFSRGSIAQISKGFVFIVIPFLYLSKQMVVTHKVLR